MNVSQKSCAFVNLERSNTGIAGGKAEHKRSEGTALAMA